jgi:hypothetical protein
VRFEVTHHQPGHHDPTTTVTDTDGVNALLAQAETAGGALRIRPHSPEADRVPEAAESASQGEPRP